MRFFKRRYLSWFQKITDVYIWIKDGMRTALYYLDLTSSLVCFVIITLLILDVGFHLSQGNKILFEHTYEYLLLYFGIDVLLRFFIERRQTFYLISRPTDLCVGLLVPLYLIDFPIENIQLLTQLGLFLVMIGRLDHFKQLFSFFRLKPAQIFPIGFLMVIFIGSLLLSFPVSTVSDQGLAYIDALFTVFSAVCVTGLSVVDVGQTFTIFGQVLILILIQIGGLGIMTFAMLLSRLLHRRISTKDSLEFQESYSTVNLKETFKTILFIFKLTLGVELMGAIGLTVSWMDDFDSLGQAAYYALFHSVSAFCNAGFSLFPDSLTSYSTNFPIVMIVALLIILGGLGFPALFNIIQVYQSKRSFHWLKLQTKLVLWMTIILIFAGTLLIFITEYNHALADYDLFGKTLIAFFQSVSARTAGFNTIDLSQFYTGTIIVLMGLMVIGASPGSTGGGIKTTSAGVIVFSFLNTLRSAQKLVVSGRSINKDSVLKAFALFFLALMIIFIFLFFLTFTETQPLLQVFFETVSAFGTVGFSLGLTAMLSSLGKGLIMVLMFIGRIGPLSLAFALSRSKPEVKYSYPEENIAIV